MKGIVVILLAVATVAICAQEKLISGGEGIDIMKGESLPNGSPTPPERTPPSAFIKDMQDAHGHWEKNGEFVVRPSSEWIPGPNTATKVVIGARNLFNEYFQRNVSGLIKGLDVFDMTTLTVSTSVQPEAVKALGTFKSVGVGHCEGWICGILQKKLGEDASVNIYASPERFSLHMVMKSIPLSNNFALKNVMIGVKGSISLTKFPSVFLEVGGELDFPRSPKVFGPGSDITLGAYFVPGLTSVTGDIVGRGTWVNAFGIKALHVRNVRGFATLNFAGTPTGTGFGATMFLGHAEKDGTLNPDNTIELQAYTSLALPGGPQATFLLAQISELSFDKLFHVLSRRPKAEGQPKRSFMKFTADMITSIALKNVYISAALVETPTRFAVVPGGLRIQGEANVFGMKAKAAILVQTVYGFPVRLMCDFEVGKIVFGTKNTNVLEISRSGKKDDPNGPKVYAEVGYNKIGAYIEGHVSLLGIGAHTVIAVDNNNFHFQVDGNLFGLINAQVTVSGEYAQLKSSSLRARIEISLGSMTEFMTKLNDRITKVVSKIKSLFEKSKPDDKEMVKAISDEDDEAEKGDDGPIDVDRELVKEIAENGRSWFGIHSISAEAALDNCGPKMEFTLTYFTGAVTSRRFFTKTLTLDFKNIKRVAKKVFKAVFSKIREFGIKVKQGLMRGINNLVKGKKNQKEIAPMDASEKTVTMAEDYDRTGLASKQHGEHYASLFSSKPDPKDYDDDDAKVL